MIESKIVSDEGQDGTKYPYLGKNTEFGCIVLFTDHHKGTLLHAGDLSTTAPGYVGEVWAEEGYVRFNGVVELQNK